MPLFDTASKRYIPFRELIFWRHRRNALIGNVKAAVKYPENEGENQVDKSYPHDSHGKLCLITVNMIADIQEFNRKDSKVQNNQGNDNGIFLLFLLQIVSGFPAQAAIKGNRQQKNER